MLLTRMCLCFLVRAGAGESGGGRQQVLLGRKKRGLGEGNIVGLGGKVETTEDPRSAAVREIAEESGVVVQSDDLDERATISFRFPSRRSWDQHATVFVTHRWQGTPVESDEISPRWYDVGIVPYDEMWDDARYWLPQVLAGGRVTAAFTFHSDLETLTSWHVVPDERAP